MLLVTISVSTVGALEPTLPQYWLTESYTSSPILIGTLPLFLFFSLVFSQPIHFGFLGVTFSAWAAGYTIMMPFVCKLFLPLLFVVFRTFFLSFFLS